MRIQHNIAAMSSYRNYTNNVAAVNKNLEKLSSGYKINRAGDDAAGLAISEKMRAQITGLEVAQKNAKDGISLVKTAEGALQEVHDMLNRMVSLATQSANGTYDNETDRYQLQKEMDQLRSEINRIADSSNFNGINLLDGSMSTEPTNYQNVSITAVRDGTTAKTAANGKYEVDLSQASWTASDTNGTVKIEIGGVSATVTISNKGGTLSGAEAATAWVNKQITNGATLVTIGTKKFTVTDDGAGKLTFTGIDSTAVSGNVTVAATGDSKISTHYTNDITNGATAGNQGWSMAWTMLEEPVDASANLLAQATFDLASLNIQDGTVLKIGNTSYTFAVGKDSKFANGSNVVDLTDMDATQVATNIKTAAARLSKVANTNSAVYVEHNSNDGKIYLTEKEGGVNRKVYDMTGKKEDESDAASTDATWKDADGVGLIQYGQSNGGGLMLQIGDTSDVFNQLRVSINDCHTKAIGIDGISIADQAGASAAIDKIKAAINYVSDVRGTLGATQNRLDHTINNLSVMRENIQDAESTIRDTDIAEEMMAYTKNNILVQSAQAMLAQANQIPQGVLQLLG